MSELEDTSAKGVCSRKTHPLWCPRVVMGVETKLVSETSETWRESDFRHFCVLWVSQEKRRSIGGDTSYKEDNKRLRKSIKNKQEIIKRDSYSKNKCLLNHTTLNESVLTLKEDTKNCIRVVKRPHNPHRPLKELKIVLSYKIRIEYERNKVGTSVGKEILRQRNNTPYYKSLVLEPWFGRVTM